MRSSAIQLQPVTQAGTLRLRCTVRQNNCMQNLPRMTVLSLWVDEAGTQKIPLFQVATTAAQPNSCTCFCKWNAGLMVKALETLVDGSSLTEDSLWALHDAFTECEGSPAPFLQCVHACAACRWA